MSAARVGFRRISFHPSLIRFLCVGGAFICADCEYECLAFTETHTKKHTLVRVIQKVEESKVSIEEKMEAVEGQLVSVQDELSKVRQLLAKLFEKGAEGPPRDPPTKSDILDAVTAGPDLEGSLLVNGGCDGDEDQDGSGDEDEDESGGDEDENESTSRGEEDGEPNDC